MPSKSRVFRVMLLHRRNPQKPGNRQEEPGAGCYSPVSRLDAGHRVCVLQFHTNTRGEGYAESAEPREAACL